MIRVISAPSISTTGFATLIFCMDGPHESGKTGSGEADPADARPYSIGSGLGKARARGIGAENPPEMVRRVLN
jgi:hypothetical protein